MNASGMPDTCKFFNKIKSERVSKKQVTYLIKKIGLFKNR